MIGTIGTLALGAVQSAVALKGLHDLSKQGVPKIIDDKVMNPILENKNYYSQRAKFGMSAEQRNSTEQSMNSAGATAFRAAAPMGSSAIGRLMTYNKMRGIVDLAGTDAQLRDQMMGKVAQTNAQISGLNQTQNTADFNLYQQKMQAMGRALSSGLTNIGSGFNSMATIQMMKDIYGQNGGVENKVQVDPIVRNNLSSGNSIPYTPLPFGQMDGMSVLPDNPITLPSNTNRYGWGMTPPNFK